MEPLLEAGHHVVGLLQNGRQTRAAHRGLFRASRVLVPPALDPASLALRRRVPIFWLDRMDDAELAPLRALAPDLLLTAGFALIFNDAMLGLPGLGCVNVHSSLLPKHRGASPFAHVVLAGETETGVTFHVMAREVDAGPILAQERIALTQLDTSVTVYYRCCDLARGMVAEVVDEIENRGWIGVPQSTEDVTRDPRMTRDTAAIDWRDSADRIERLVRAAVAYYPAWFTHRGRRVDVTRATFDPRPIDAAPGTVLETRPYPVVATGRGRLIIHAAHVSQPIPWSWPTLCARLRRDEYLAN
jgi:methionyl-tRNA formyltransferase